MKILCCELCAQLNVLKIVFANGNYAVMQPADSLFQKFKQNLSLIGHSSFKPICCRGFFQSVRLFNFRNGVRNVVIDMRYFVYCILERHLFSLYFTLGRQNCHIGFPGPVPLSPETSLMVLAAASDTNRVFSNEQIP